ncbi:MAG: amidohydrolase [bacterium]|nr:amidohydrolase [bacterium]
MTRHLAVSSDCHAGLPPERYRDYLESKHHDAFDRAVAAEAAQRDALGKLFLIDEFNEKWKLENWDGLTGAWDHDRRIEVLDGDGIAVEVIFPDGITENNSPPFDAGLGLGTEGVDPELQWAGARAHNRWLSEFCSITPERHIGLAIVPALWDVDEAIAEVRWARKNGLRGVMLPVMWGTQPPYHLDRYDPLWAVCAELEMPIHFHSGPSPKEDYFAFNPDGSLAIGAVGAATTEFVWWLTRPLNFLIWGGVFERHPDLRVAITEGSGDWVPPFLETADRNFSETHISAKMGDFTSHLSMKPSEYFRRNVAVGTSLLKRTEVEQREAIGLESIMWGTDYPHPEGCWPNTDVDRRALFRDVPESDLAAMLGGNAARFYKLDVDALAPIVERIGPPRSDFA